MKIVTFASSRFRLDGGAMFGVVPKALWSRQVKADDENRIGMITRTVFVETQDRKILVDVGVGAGYEAKFVRNLGIDPEAPSLEERLSGIGVSPAEITDVVLTHLHFDHCGGLTRPDGEGTWVPVFPNARHFVQQRHLEYARNSSRRDQASFRPERYEPVAQAGLFDLLDGPARLADEVELFVVEGHTPGMQVPVITLEGGGRLFVPSDLIPMRPHVSLPWVMAFDLQPLTTLQEKEALLDRAVREGWAVLFQHDPECPLARIDRTERDFVAGPVREPYIEIVE